MKNMRKSLALFLTIVMVLSTMVTSIGAAVTGTGDISDPFVCETVADMPATVTIPAGGTLFYTVPAGGLTLTVVDETTATNVVGPRGNVLAYTSDGMGVAEVAFDMGYMAGDIVMFGLLNQNPRAEVTVTVSIGEGAPAEVGSEKNPANANELYNSMIGYYLLNPQLEAGDVDGYWYAFTAEEDGILCLENSSADGSEYQIIVDDGKAQYLAFDGDHINPIATYRLTKGDVVKIQVMGEYDANWNIAAAKVYASFSVVDGSEDDPVKIKSASFKAYVLSGDTVYYTDSTKEASYAGKGLEISGYSEAIAAAVVTVNGTEYTDVDGDGKIEIALPGDYYSRPVIGIKNNHDWNISFTLKTVESAVEGNFCPCGNAVLHIDAVEACHADGTAEYWYCEECDVVYADAACTQVTNRMNLMIPAENELVHVDAVEPGCHYEGNVEYWYCPECGAYYTDAEGTQVTNSKSVILPELGGEIVHFDAVEPGCHSNGNIEYWVCYDCEQFWADEARTQLTNSKNVVLPATEHANLVHFEAVEPGCHSLGNIEYWYCPDCEGFWQDEALTQLTNSKNVVLPATGSENVVHFDAVEPGCHYNGNVEYWFCADCEGFWTDEACTQVTNTKNVVLPATGSDRFGHVEAVAPGCHSDGNIEYWFCAECECYWADEALTQLTNSKNVILPATGEGNVIHFDAVEPACHFNGNIEYWYCTECEVFWQDEALTQITNSKNVVLPATGSENVEHTAAVEPNCYEGGNVEYWYCSDCEGFWLDEACTQITNAMSVKLPATHVNLIHFDAIEPACHYEGNIEYWFCPDCEGCWADGALRQVTNLKSVVLPETGEGNVVHVDAVEPGCHFIGNVEYWYCTECEVFWQDEALTQITNSKNVIVAATGSENVVHFDAIEPACHYNGNVEYWYCADCEGFWTDEACTQVTNSKSVVLPATGSENLVHFDAIEPACHYNGNVEYWFCPDCEGFWLDEACTRVTNSKSVVLPATGEGNVIHFEAVEPGCHYEGCVEYWFCADCEGFWLDEACTRVTNSKNIVVPALGSENVEHFEAVEPACHYNGNVEYWFCADCEGFWLDEACTRVTNSKNVILPAVGTENLIHFEAVEPACHYNGNIEYWYCADCEGFWQDEALTQVTNSKRVIIPALGSENVEHFEAVEPGCHSLGNIEYWFCADCEGYWQDEALTQLTNSKRVILPELGSDNIKHVDAVAPTATENGNIEYWYCADCNSYYQDEACTQLTNALRVILPATGEEAPEDTTAPEEDTTAPETDKENAPATGDSVMLLVALSIVSAMGLMAVVVLRRKSLVK